MTTLEFPHCFLHVLDPADLLDLEMTTGLGYQVILQVPGDYRSTKKYRCTQVTQRENADPRHRSELCPPSRWDYHSGYLWFDTRVFPDLKDAFKAVMLELAAVGWWELAEEIYEQTLAHSQSQAGERGYDA